MWSRMFGPPRGAHVATGCLRRRAGLPTGGKGAGASKGPEGLGAGEHDELCGSSSSSRKIRDAGVGGVCAGQAQSPMTEG
jgi:hypothetical protein